MVANALPTGGLLARSTGSLTDPFAPPSIVQPERSGVSDVNLLTEGKRQQLG